MSFKSWFGASKDPGGSWLGFCILIMICIWSLVLIHPVFKFRLSIFISKVQRTSMYFKGPFRWKTEHESMVRYDWCKLSLTCGMSLSGHILSWHLFQEAQELGICPKRVAVLVRQFSGFSQTVLRLLSNSSSLLVNLFFGFSRIIRRFWSVVSSDCVALRF